MVLRYEQLASPSAERESQLTNIFSPLVTFSRPETTCKAEAGKKNKKEGRKRRRRRRRRRGRRRGRKRKYLLVILVAACPGLASSIQIPLWALMDVCFSCYVLFCLA
jgi:hypothetical protein